MLWFRRDLRLSDHPALVKAVAENARVVPVFVFDDALLSHPLTGSGRVQFMLESLADLDANLRKRGGYLVTRRGVPHEEIARLCRETGATRVYYHVDTDRVYGRERDAALAANLPHLELIPVAEGRGVFDGADARVGWADKWERATRESVLPTPERVCVPPNLATLGIPTLANLSLPASAMRRVTPGGESWALARLDSFLRPGGHVENYRRHVGNPRDCERGLTSRLSAPLSFGCLSSRVVAQRSWAEQENKPGCLHREQWHSRVVWRDHFTQKQRDWKEAQFESVNPVYDAIRQDLDNELFERWKAGQTGFPLVDAAMRALSETGFLNFRMRAMVASVWSYHLWQPWQPGAEWFQKCLIDFDTAINSQQWQMQSGTVGHHANRLYDPTKQFYEHDPLGVFVAAYVPELAGVPMPKRATPHLLSAADRDRYGATDYPAPIVDIVASSARARAEFKRLAPAARAFLATDEGRRRASTERLARGEPPRGVRENPPAAPPQLSLFGDD